MKTMRDKIDKTISEAEFMSQVIQLAKIYGWRCYHTTDSQRSQAGFPDLVMVRGDRLIFAELKAEKGSMKEEQRAWYDALYLTAAEVFIWKPRDWDAIVATLTRWEF